MTGRITAALLALALAGVGSAPAAAQRVDLSALDAAMPGPPTRVLVLGSVHLSQGGAAAFDPATLEPVLQRLAAYRPGIITIEALSGETCELLRRRAIYRQVMDYCPDVAAARAATGLDGPAALDAMDAALRDWPAQPTPAQRRRLASVFLAVGEPASALVQWWQLPEVERRTGDGLGEALVQDLRKREANPNENYQLAARLAARLGLQRLHAVDDHVGDNLDIRDEGGFEKAIRQAWAGASETAKQAQERIAGLRARGTCSAPIGRSTHRTTCSPPWRRTSARHCAIRRRSVSAASTWPAGTRATCTCSATWSRPSASARVRACWRWSAPRTSRGSMPCWA